MSKNCERPPGSKVQHSVSDDPLENSTVQSKPGATAAEPTSLAMQFPPASDDTGALITPSTTVERMPNATTNCVLLTLVSSCVWYCTTPELRQIVRPDGEG